MIKVKSIAKEVLRRIAVLLVVLPVIVLIIIYEVITSKDVNITRVSNGSVKISFDNANDSKTNENEQD